MTIADRRDGQEAGVVERIEVTLRSRSVDGLPKKTLLVEQTDPHHRDPEIVRRLEVVASHVPEPPGVEGQRFREGKLEAEERDRFELRSLVRRLEPGGRALAACRSPRMRSTS